MTSSKSWQPSSSSKYHHHNHSIFNVCLVIFKSNQISLLFSFFSLFLFSGKNHLPKRKKCFHFLFHTGQVRTNNIFFHLKRSISFIFYVWRQILCPKYPGFYSSFFVCFEWTVFTANKIFLISNINNLSIDRFIENKKKKLEYNRIILFGFLLKKLKYTPMNQFDQFDCCKKKVIKVSINNNNENESKLLRKTIES